MVIIMIKRVNIWQQNTPIRGFVLGFVPSFVGIILKLSLYIYFWIYYFYSSILCVLSILSSFFKHYYSFVKP